MTNIFFVLHDNILDCRHTHTNETHEKDLQSNKKNDGKETMKKLFLLFYNF